MKSATLSDTDRGTHFAENDNVNRELPMQPTTTLPPPTRASRTAFPRVQAIDIVRGLVMVVMALDHVREFWNPTLIQPEDVSQTSVGLFLTRWVTHFCAPTFVFLSGTSVYFYALKQPSRGAVSRFLITRGLWLVVMEVLVVNLLLQWSYHYQFVLLQVIWAIGWSMVLLAGLIWLPRWLLTTLTVVVIGGHNLLPTIAVKTPADAALALLHNSPSLIPLPGLPPLLNAYTLVPWFAVMLAGYLIGPWFQLPLPDRQRRLRLAGIALLVLFVVLRGINVYGNATPWAVQPRGLTYTVLSFVNITKYPPALLFLCLTLGVALLLLSSVETATSRLSQWLRTFGQVPFFYYLLHLLLNSIGAAIWTSLAFGRPVDLSFTQAKDLPAEYHSSLLRAYVAWALLILALYWPCRWYRNFKQQHTYWWLSYL
ncbi:DUF1624 domain-containing protein [Hymenobacter sp. GOD-10R]|uniref:DUF1624 domain-containing protein n=1 Tax=Hymenobacter sp. GOD-10R TaxID=3093922 RepID=UPI002D77C91D|nr:heparan-alpha-glucosaminide N-acetyltransferase domain-containing protein [Hymenobacter sp. GOD-10R]WRQ26969.1 heparan-alpha-glucosaminide N-acetyltransferase domain-containing protein [Hymenobacter sp. GOD-10R]